MNILYEYFNLSIPYQFPISPLIHRQSGKHSLKYT
nr:MAG TPA_asm: hypothetical protein [Caudoviricetes sp.]